MSKNAGNRQILEKVKFEFLVEKKYAGQSRIKILTWNQSHMKLRFINFSIWKKLIDTQLKPLLFKSDPSPLEYDRIGYFYTWLLTGQCPILNWRRFGCRRRNSVKQVLPFITKGWHYEWSQHNIFLSLRTCVKERISGCSCFPEDNIWVSSLCSTFYCFTYFVYLKLPKPFWKFICVFISV